MIAESMALGATYLLAGSLEQKGPRSPMDEAKFELFYRKTAGGLWSYLYRLTGDGSTADDLLQKTFVRVLRANAVFASDDHLRRYLYRTATSSAMDHFREAKRRPETIPIADRAISISDRSDLRHDMMRVFAELKPQERALLWLAHVEESDHDEIGAALGVKPKSVRVLLFRARKRLSEVLQRHGLGPEVLS
jgi:RNA polymerase sigma-70 factor (ECF subfamily)